jgi:hypothetical protein
MIQPRRHLRFAGEAGEPVGIARKGLPDLDRHIAIQLSVDGAPDPAPAALAELGCDSIVGDRPLGTHRAGSFRYGITSERPRADHAPLGNSFSDRENDKRACDRGFVSSGRIVVTPLKCLEPPGEVPDEEFRIPHKGAPCRKQYLEIGRHIPKRIASHGRSGEVKCPYRPRAGNVGVKA